MRGLVEKKGRDIRVGRIWEGREERERTKMERWGKGTDTPRICRTWARPGQFARAHYSSTVKHSLFRRLTVCPPGPGAAAYFVPQRLCPFRSRRRRRRRLVDSQSLIISVTLRRRLIIPFSLSAGRPTDAIDCCRPTDRKTEPDVVAASVLASAPLLALLSTKTHDSNI